MAAKEREQMTKSGANDREYYLKRYQEIANFVAFTPPELNDVNIYRLSQMCNEWQDMLFDFPIISSQYDSNIHEQLNMLYQNSDSDDSKERSSGVSSPSIPSHAGGSSGVAGFEPDLENLEEPVVNDDVDLLPSFEEIRPKSCEPPTIEDPAEKIVECFLETLNTNGTVNDASKCNMDKNVISSDTVQVENNDERGNGVAHVNEKEESNFRVFKISDDCKNNRDRVEVVDKWHSQGGVLLLGYEMFRLLSRLSPRYSTLSSVLSDLKISSNIPVYRSSCCVNSSLSQR